MTAFERKFPPQPAELPPARAALKAWLHDVGVDGEDATADVLVVASELVTNGVFHDGGDPITLRADRQDRDVSIEVTTVDHLPGQHPTYRDVEDSAEGGRGLEIVHALSHGYSVLRHDNERVTECRVTTSDDESATVVPADSRAPTARRRARERTRPKKEGRSQPGTSE
jgi:anti-sigma regulatory factor (Ser/Thr protein kinase)